jgi:hypothetical protein
MRIADAMVRYIKNPFKIIRAMGTRGILNWLPDKPYLKLVYWGETGKKLNLDVPVTYNEKLQWLKLYDRKPEYIKYADKYAVRSYIRETIGEQYLIPLLGVYENVEEINWDLLPNKFVLKCTHGSGANIICTDKDNLDVKDANKKLNKWMKKSWYWFGREWAYKNIKPCIVCEQFIESTGDRIPIDYKFMCFNGVPKLVQVHLDRYGLSYKKDFYDVRWNKTSICSGVPNSTVVTTKPRKFDCMMEIARKLSKDMPYARIDFYEQNGNVYFGEITLYPTSGFTRFKDHNDDIILGSWIKLPIDK